MAALLASSVHSPITAQDLSFCRAFAPRNFPSFETSRDGGEFSGFTIEARSSGSGSPPAKINGRAPRMVPVEEATARIRKSSSISDTVNGSAKKVINGSAVNGRVNGSNSRALVSQRTRKINGEYKRILPELDVKVLPSDEGFSWSNDNYSKLQRNIDVWSFILSLRARTYLDDAKWTYIGGFSEEKQKIRRRGTASWLRECILQLGPTFIKLGQLSSTRTDLFPKEFVEELAKLQDRVPAVSSQKARGLIEKELGFPINMIFKEFEDQPIAAASLGQVHRAVLQNGERAAVKVQRPGLKRLFDIDLENLKLIAEFFQNSETLGGPTRDWVGVYEECRTILYQEINYIKEGRNADRFRRDFRNTKWVRVPEIYWDYTTEKILTLEYVPGIKINNLDLLDAGDYDRSQIARRAVESYLIQILKTGFFHADPHPGNLAIDVDGSLIYYDFGMMGEIKSFTKDRLLQMFYAVYEKDAKKVIQSLIDLGALQPTGDMASVRRSIQFFLDRILNQKPDQEATLSAIGEDLFAVAVDQPFRFPSTFTFVLRAFSTLEGIGYTLNPDFSFAKIAAPYAQELLDMRESKRNGTSIVQEIQRQANDENSGISPTSARLKLYSYWHSSCAWRIRIALNLKGLPYDYKAVDIGKGEHLSEEYTKLNPLRLVPTLVDGDIVVSDSLAILLYLEDKFPEHPLLPDDLHLKAVSLQVAALVGSSIQPFQNLGLLNLIEEKFGPEERLAWPKHFIEKGFTALEQLLKDVAGKYSVGDQLTLADIFLAPQVYNARRFNVDMSKFPTLNRINQELAELPEFQAALPERQPDAKA